MKQLKLIAATTLLISTVIVCRAAPGNTVAGNWRGTLEVGAVKLRLVFKISQSASGDLTGKMDSLDQGARDIPVNSVTIKDNSLRLEVNSVNGVYEGTLDKSGLKATGQWTQGGKALPLALEKSEAKGVPAESEKLSPADLIANKLAAQKLAGTWNGTLAAGTTQLRLRVKISKTSDGMATGTMDSLDQGGKDIPLSAITFKDGEVRFEARGIGGTYQGKLDGANLKGEWQQGGQSLPLALTKVP